MPLKESSQKYGKSKRGKAVKKKWKNKNRGKIRKWKRDWASSLNGRISAKKWYKKSPIAMYSLYKRSAIRRNIKFSLSRKQFLKLIVLSCLYCGNKPPKETKRNGLDRVDNNIGYVLKNIVPCCMKCNQMKGKKTVQEFIMHINRIFHFQRGEQCH